MIDVLITSDYEHLIDDVNAYLIVNNIEHTKGKTSLDIIVYFNLAQEIFDFSDNVLKFVRERHKNGAYRFSIEKLENGSYCLELINCWDY